MPAEVEIADAITAIDRFAVVFSLCSARMRIIITLLFVASLMEVGILEITGKTQYSISTNLIFPVQRQEM